jgi:hypothetical protein
VAGYPVTGLPCGSGTTIEVGKQIDSVSEAFQSRKLIRDEAVAQAYLVSLLGAKERRPNEPKPPKARTERKKKGENIVDSSGGGGV